MTDDGGRLPLKEGKLPPDALARLLAYTSQSPQVLVGASSGEDAAVVVGAERIVITADPITFTEENIGTYTVAVNCNDIVAMGGKPRYLTTTILAPPGTTVTRLERVFSELKTASKSADILWIGGHTEITTAVDRIVVSGHLVGFLFGRATPSSGARPGDAIVMTKWAGLEGTTVIARERPEETRNTVGESSFAEIVGWLENPGISIVAEGRALESAALSSGHDPTEGGIATGICEIALRSDVGAVILEDNIRIRTVTRKLCRAFALDPLGLLSSGVFLFTAAPPEAEKAVSLLQAQSIPASTIGTITDRSGEILLKSRETVREIPRFDRDEIIRILS